MAKKRTALLALLLALVMVLATACSAGGEIKPPVNTDPDSDASPAVSNSGNSSKDITIEETVIYEADGIKITATEYVSSWSGPEIKMLIENNSDKDVLITDQMLSVNGYMMSSASLYAEVAAGKKANESLSFYSTDLRQAGIETVADVQFRIDVSELESWDTLALSDLITLQTSAAGLKQPVDDSGKVIYDSKDIKIVCQGLKQDVLWDGTLVFYIENNSGRDISVYTENVSINGFMEDSSLWSDLRSGTRIVDGLYLTDLSNVELASVDEIKNIEFGLRIVTYDNWDDIDDVDKIALDFN